MKNILNTKIHMVKIKGREKDIPHNCYLKKAEKAIFISYKVNFRAKNITREKEGHLIMIKNKIHPETITICNLYIL